MTPCTLHCLISAKAVEKNLNKNAVSKSDNGGSFQHSPSFILYPFIHLGSKDCQNLGYPAPLDQNRLMDKLRMLTPTSDFINQHPSQQILWVIPIPTKFWQQLWVICSFAVTATSSCLCHLQSKMASGVLLHIWAVSIERHAGQISLSRNAGDQRNLKCKQFFKCWNICIYLMRCLETGTQV